MLELNLFRNQTERVKEGLLKKNPSLNADEIIQTVISLDDQRKSLQTSIDSQLAEVNKLSKEIGDLFKSGKSQEANALKDSVTTLKEDISLQEAKYSKVIIDLDELVVGLPNIPNESVPFGKSADDNEVYQDWDEGFTILHDGALPHWELGDKYELFSLPLGVKITGAGFPVYMGKGARLQRALISFFLDEANRAGYKEIIPPLLVNSDSAYATGQLPDKEGQMYHAVKDDLYLIPTAEVPVTNIYRDEIVSEEDLPIKLTGYTPCFRREAGSYGADVKGLNRVHQFDKVEIVQMVKPEDSYRTLMEMVGHVESLLKKLELPYRILRLCGGDMSFASALTYDFEVYSIAQERWLEVSSVSNFETFQSNRLKTRYKTSDGKKELVHTLNGSALALARIVASILENNQTPEGIVIPSVLTPYTGFNIID